MDFAHRAHLRASHGGAEFDPRHRGDTGQRLAAETETGNTEQVVGTDNLAGGVTLQRQGKIFRRQTAAVVLHPHQRNAAVLSAHVNLLRTSIQTVFHQLFDNGGRALHHLAGRDLVGNKTGKAFNAG